MIESIFHSFADQPGTVQIAGILTVLFAVGGGGMYAWIMSVDRRERRERAQQVIQRH